MATVPSHLKQISLFLERLPGIGSKTANRLAFYLLRMPEVDLQDFAEAVRTLKKKTKLCSICMNFTEHDVCEIDVDKTRDHTTITVVEEVPDLLSLEAGNIYHGVYHVLHGRIDPLNNIGPDDIYLEQLMKRVKTSEDIKEIILATNPDMEGEATAVYIRNQIVEIQKHLKRSFTISRLGYGLPMGANLEYADYMTLKKSLENRNSY